MTSQQLEKRRRVMKRSIALGHCVCDVQQPCPCEQFKHQDICHCAGEKVPPVAGPVRLTQHVRNAGCASKISKAALQEILDGLPDIRDPRVLVGASAGDDAGVIMLSENAATILTVDVFCPAVDDPYTFGQIAAANSLSDIYAMGATPQVALSIIGFPIASLPPDAMRQILRGGIDKMREAGVPVIGGHSINDEEVKCGFAVVGSCPKNAYVRNAGALVGDAIVLTKPLGTGITVFAHQVGRASDDLLAPVAHSMTTLNQLAGQLMVQYGAHAATDVTGFSLLGHMAEIVQNSRVEATLDFDAIPLFDGVAQLAADDVLPGAVERNRESVPENLLDLAGLTPPQQAILFGPETSGGLLVFLPAANAHNFVDQLRAAGVPAHLIGSATASSPQGRIRATSGKTPPPTPPVRKPTPQPTNACCCADQSVAAAPANDAHPAGARPPPAPAPTRLHRRLQELHDRRR